MALHEAQFWEALDNSRVQCRLCHHGCSIKPGQKGLCGVRENRAGTLYSQVYARPAAQNIDPIEKKPLYHFLPGTKAFSIGTYGCNFRCLHCQNCRISQVSDGLDPSLCPVVEPEDIVQHARETGCRSIAYTYTEPTIFYEYAMDTARLAKEAGLFNLFVTNGYITAPALREAAPYLQAANVDLKFFTDELYRKVCGARLQPILDSIRLYHELGIWLEVTTLLIPGYNDDDEQLRGIAGFITGLNKQIPWHVTAFHPTYKLNDAPPTPHKALTKARSIAVDAGLKHVYLGNIAGDTDTHCPDCGEPVIRRNHRTVSDSHLTHEGCCPHCGTAVAGVWSQTDSSTK